MRLGRQTILDTHAFGSASEAQRSWSDSSQYAQAPEIRRSETFRYWTPAQFGAASQGSLHRQPIRNTAPRERDLPCVDVRKPARRLAECPGFGYPYGCPEIAEKSPPVGVQKSGLPRGCPEVGTLAMGWKVVSGQGFPVCFESAWSAAANAGDEPPDRDAGGPAEAIYRLEMSMIQRVAGRFSSESRIWGSSPGTPPGGP
jgi:hypothetical protein